VREFAGMSNLDVWYSRLTADEIVTRWASDASASLVQELRHEAEQAESKTRLRAFDDLTCAVDGERRFVSDPPLLVPVRELLGEAGGGDVFARVEQTLHEYTRTVEADRQHLLSRYRFVDLARKVVGVGSVGTRCWVALLVGHDEHDPLFLQVKEAEASVLDPYLTHSGYEQHGQRVVQGQRLMQATSDILLGWARVEGLDGREHDYYFRQLWDWKGSAPVGNMSRSHLLIYGQICGYTLARAHARSGHAISIAAYAGGGGHMSRSIGDFARAYADQTEADHATFRRWVAEGCPSPH
jgi:hypothetical protein